MHARFLAVLLVIPTLALRASAQESTHELKKFAAKAGTGRPADDFDKYTGFLTPGQIDSWLFDAEKDETIVVHVASDSFDPMLGLALTAAKQAKQEVTIVADVDDPGTESRFMKRLPEKGKYKIRITAFKNQAGGNYSLKVWRFQPGPLELGKMLLATFDSDGRGYYYFSAKEDTILIPEVKGRSAKSWTMLDTKGRPMPEWEGAVSVAKSGEYCLVVSGQSDHRYEVIVRLARQHVFAEDQNLDGNLQQGELEVWNFQGKPGDFRLLAIDKKGVLVSRLIYAPLDMQEKQSDQPIKGKPSRAELVNLPVASRGKSVRYAAILGRDGRYQLQILASSACSYKLTSRDPSIPLEIGKQAQGQLPVGETVYYSFKAATGQLLSARVASGEFVPELHFYDKDGILLGESAAGDDALAGRLTRMIEKEGLYRLQVSSSGHGGGGKFVLELQESKVKDLPIGERSQGTIQVGAMDFWTFAGKEGQTVFLNVRSSSFDPSVIIRSAAGVTLTADSSGNTEIGSLIALKLPKTGRYSVWISSTRGSGDYVVRLIDGD